VEPPGGLAKRLRVLPPLLRENADFRLFWVGQAVSLFGDQITLLALPLAAVLVLNANAQQMGYLSATSWVPYLLFSLHVGSWLDRRGRRRRAMIVADAGRAILLATVPAAYFLGGLTMVHLYSVAFLVGAFSVLFSVAYSTLFISLVSRDRYVEGSAILSGTRALSLVGGPSLAGVLVQLVSAPVALGADALSFVISWLCLNRIAPQEPPVAARTEGALVGGARFIVESPLFRAMLAGTTTINFFNLAFSAIFVLYAVRILHVQPGILGIVLGAGAVGAVLGSMITGWLTRRIGIGPTLVLGCIMFPLPLVLVPLAAGPMPLVLSCLLVARFGSGLGVMILDTSYAAISAALVPFQLRARVTGAYSLANNGIRPLGSLFGGLLGAAIGLRPTLWIVTVAAIAGVLWLLPSPMLKLRGLSRPGDDGPNAAVRPEP
jgi:MFS family permease